MKRIAMIQMFAWVGLALAAPQVGAEGDKDGNATPTPVSTPGSPTPSPTLMIRQTTILIAALSFWTACLLPLPSALHADDDATTSTMRRTRLVGYFPPINGVPVHNHIERVCLLAPDFGRADAPIANLVFIGRPGRTVLVAAFEDGEVVWHRNWRAPFPGWPPERLPDHTPLMGPYYRARVDPTLVDDFFADLVAMEAFVDPGHPARAVYEGLTEANVQHFDGEFLTHITSYSDIEIVELSKETLAGAAGNVSLKDVRREVALAQQPPDFLRFRKIRGRIVTWLLELPEHAIDGKVEELGNLPIVQRCRSVEE